MLVSRTMTRSLSVSRRAAFTLVEVLVVVAIVVILASIGTLATFKFLEDAKGDAARAKAEQLVTYGKAWSTRNDSEPIQSLDVLIPYADDGVNALRDPWNNPFQFEYVNDGASQYPRLFVYTIHRVDGQDRVIGAPKDIEILKNGGR